MPEPLINSPRSVHENVGTIINFRLFDIAPVQKYSIGRFRQNHPELAVNLSYGVFAIRYPNSTPGLGHGNFLRISDQIKTRFYWWASGNMHVDEHLIYRQMVRDWEEQEEWDEHAQLHWPDLCWFDPPYGAPGWREVRSREQLGEEINRRLAALGLN